MAIAYVVGSANGGTNGGVGTTLAFSVNVGAGTDRALIAGCWANTNAAISADYNGIAMSEVITRKYSSTNETLHVYVLSNPDSGSNTLTFTGSGSIELWGEASAYTGCHQTTATLSNAVNDGETGATTPITVAVTPSTDDTWAVAFYGGQRNGTASTNVTGRFGDGTQGAVGDSNATITNGAPYSMSYTIVSALRQIMGVVAIAPSAGGGGGVKLFTLLGVGT